MTEQPQSATPAPEPTPAPVNPTTPTDQSPPPEAPKLTPATTDSLVSATPETFDVSAIKLPDGFTLADEAKTQLGTALAGLPPERAQSLVDLHAAEVQRIAKASVDANVKAWNDVMTQWRREIEADPNIGGANLGKTKAAISRLVNEFGDGGSGFREAMNLTGAGNNPHVVRFLTNIASKLYEGGAVQGNPANSGSNVNIADVFYPQKKG